MESNLKKQCKLCNPKKLKEQEYLKIKEFENWVLYIGKSQQCIGWCDLVLKRHIEFFEDISEKEFKELKKIISKWKNSLKKLFKPDWFNIMQLGNSTKHLHFLLVPRYKNTVVYKRRKFIDKDYSHMLKERWNPENDDFLKKLAKDIQENL
jgi:diadenosine tetraphosphate (Ap4A) HIT family hydrolase